MSRSFRRGGTAVGLAALLILGITACGQASAQKDPAASITASTSAAAKPASGAETGVAPCPLLSPADIQSALGVDLPDHDHAENAKVDSTGGETTDLGHGEYSRTCFWHHKNVQPLQAVSVITVTDSSADGAQQIVRTNYGAAADAPDSATHGTRKLTQGFKDLAYVTWDVGTLGLQVEVWFSKGPTQVEVDSIGVASASPENMVALAKLVQSRI